MDSNSDRLSPVELLAEEFLDRQQRGERPTIEEYCQRHPELAEEIRDVFEGFLLIEELKPGSNDVSESGDGRIDGRKLVRIRDYRIIREVGRGGMGIVFEAEQESLGRRVALKVLPRQIAGDQKALKRFQQEARAAARMHHTNIVPVFEVGNDDEHVFYAMQLIQGQGLDAVIDDLRRLRSEHSGLPVSPSDAVSLAERSHANGLAASLVRGEFEPDNLLPESDGERGSQEHKATVIVETRGLDSGSTASAVLPGQSEISTAERDRGGYYLSVARIGHQTAGALAYAHARGIIHRDIKPSNLLLDTAGIVWVTDFGLAKTGDEGLTHTGDILGTLRYMSPERFKGQCDVRADVYSLGLTLYELLVLKPAFSSPDRLKLIEMVSKSDPPTPRSLDPRIPRDLETIVLKSIDKDPRRRYQSADDLSDDLERFIQDEPIQARRISLGERLARWSRRNKSLAVSLGVLASVIFAAAIGSTIAAGYFRNLSRTLEVSEDRLTAVVRDLEENQERLMESRAREKQRADEMKALAAARDRSAQAALAARDEARRQTDLSRRSEYVSTLFAAQHALTTVGGYTRGKELLEGLRPQAGEPDLRGIEFHLLNSLPDISGGRIIRNDLRGFRDDLGFSPDGRYLASVSGSQTIVVLEVETGEIQKRFYGHTHSVRQVLWNSDGTQVISCDRGETIHVWDVQQRSQLRAIPGGRCFALSPDETRLVCGTGTGLVQIRDAFSGEALETFEGHAGRVHCVDWSVRDQIASCSADGTVRLWDLKTSEPHLLIDNAGPGPSEWSFVSFNPDGTELAASTYEPVREPVVIWDAERLEKKRALPVDRGMPTFAWSHDGTRLAGHIYPAAAVEIWDATTGQRVRRFDGVPSQVRTCSWSPDDRQLASRTLDGIVQVWEVEQHEPTAEFGGSEVLVNQVSWSPDGRCFATACSDGAVQIWNVRSKRKLCEFEGHESRVEGVDWHPQENLLVSFGPSETLIWKWDGRSNALEIGVLSASTRNMRFNDVVWSPDGTQIATAEGTRRAQDGRVQTYDYDEVAGTFVKSQEFARFGAVSLSWEQDGTGTPFLAAAGAGTFKVWNSATGEEVLSEWPRADFVSRVSLSPQADRVAIATQSRGGPFGEAGSSGQILQIVDLTTQHELQLSGHGIGNTVHSLDWLADGTRVLTGGADGTCMLWDAATGRQLVTFQTSDGLGVRSARFSPDALQIAIAGGGAQLLDATPSYAEQLSEHLLPRLAERIDARPTFEDLVLRGRIHARQGNWDKAAADFERAARVGATEAAETSWFETAWWLAGPYPEPLADAQPPEQQLDPQQPIPAADALGEPTAWSAMGISEALDLSSYLAAAEHVSAYMQTRVYATDGQTIGLLLGADDTVRVWSNGQLVHTRTGNRVAIRDDEAVEIRLEPGWNTLLVKVANESGAHGLIARFSDDPRELAEIFDRNNQWKAALKWTSRALVRNPSDTSLLYLRGRAALRTGERQLADECFDRMIETADNKSVEYRRVAELYLEHARSLSHAGRPEDSASSLDRARALYEQLVHSERAIESDAGGLAAVLLLTAPQTEWTVLEPVEMRSAGGATLTPLDDGSILAGGENVAGDRYEFEWATDLKEVTAVRLEALTDDSLPNRGPGRRLQGSEGIFVMTWWEWWQEPSHTRLVFDAVDADYFDTRWPLTFTHWNITGGAGEPHEAIYRLKTPVQSDSGSRFTMHMQFLQTEAYPLNNLGRFRISVCSEQGGFENEANRLAINRITNGWERLAAAYRAIGDEAAFDALVERRPAAAVGYAALVVDAAGWTEQVDPTLVSEAVQSVLDANPNRFDVRNRILEICSNAHDWQLCAAGLQTLFKHQRATGASNQQLAEILRRRGALYVRAGEWRSAAGVYSEAAQLDQAASSTEWMAAAALFAYADDAQGHSEHCQAMRERFQPPKHAGGASEFDRWTQAEQTMKSMLLLETQFGPELAPETFPARPVLEALKSTLGPRMVPWFNATRALWTCRNPVLGDPRDALQWVDSSGVETGRVGLLQLTVQALIHARAGNASSARTCLDRVRLLMETDHGLRWLKSGLLDGKTILRANSGLVDHDLLIPEILRREAERLLQDADASPAADAQSLSDQAPRS